MQDLISRRLRSLIAVALLVSTLAAACASGPETGVRTDFEQANPTTVAIAPFYERGSFGLDAETREQLRADYQRAAEETLRSRGFDVVEAQTLREHLIDRNAWTEFEEGINLRSSLTSYFEPRDGTDTIEVQTVRRLAERGAFPADAILFGEIVYYSEGSCRQRADRNNPYARLFTTPTTPAELPRPCVSSHFQAKLVDPDTGHTMWFNRTFIETHTSHVDREIGRDTISRTVGVALTDDGDGIVPLAPSPGNEAHAGSP